MDFSPDKPDDSKQIKVVFAYKKNNEKKYLFGIENNKEISCRQAYNEQLIIKECTVDSKNQSISLVFIQQQFSFVEQIVSMTKLLLQSIYTTETGKWDFTRLQLKIMPDVTKISTLKISMIKNFNFKLIKCEIADNNNNKLGDIFFSLVKER